MLPPSQLHGVTGEVKDGAWAASSWTRLTEIAYLDPFPNKTIFTVSSRIVKSINGDTCLI